MKHRQRNIILLLLLLASLRIAAQVPDWYEAANRKTHYPSVSWYTGFVMGEQRDGEALEDTYARLKTEARAELVSTIRTSVEHNSIDRAQSDLEHSSSTFDERIMETYVSDTRVRSNITDIPGLKVEAWRKGDGTIAAFAYVKKITLSTQLIKRIALGIAKIENSIDQAETLQAEGRTLDARQVVKTGLQQLHEVEDAQSLLNIVDETADEDILQYSQTRNMQQRLGALDTQLKNAVKVYIDCRASLFDTDYTNLTGSVRGELSSLGVTFVTSPEKADWAVYVNASAREDVCSRFGSTAVYSAYVDVSVAIDKNNGQRIYEEQLKSERGTHTANFAEAARIAYKKITPLIEETIKQYMQ